LLTGSYDYSRDYASEKYSQGKAGAGEWKSYSNEKIQDARGEAGEKVKKGGARLKGEM
jgi:hypothetical protein